MTNSPVHFDWWILICVIILCGIGAAVITSVTPDLAGSQIFYYFLGFGLFFIFSRIDYHIYEPLAKTVYILSLVLLAFTLFLGLESRGSVRWISLGSFRLQFSEIFKPFLVTTFATFLLKSGQMKFSRFLLLMLSLAIPIFLIFKQPDLGSSLVYSLGLLIMLIISDVSLLYIALSILSTLLFIPIIWTFLASYQRQRVLSFLSPHYDPLGASYNAIQSVITVGSGMIFGRGLGRGTQSHLLFLPERHTDFIFASIAEELGFIGSFLVVTIYFLLIWRIFSSALKIEDNFGKLVSVGIGSFILIQVFINIGMNLGILPVTGITLPLISYGGSSLLSTMIGLGIVENIVAHEREQKTLHIV